MLVEQIWTANAYRNFNYLVACPETGIALAVDPLDYRKCLQRAGERGWDIRMVVNTHEHGDHTGGNGGMVAATDAQLLAQAEAGIDGIDRGLRAGDVVVVGSTVELQVLDTPGHTMTHICLLSRTDPPALFCGDTLFNAGAGNCHNGGHPKQLYQTFAEQLAPLPDPTRIYPGHDYIVNNLGFTLDREPANSEAAALLARLRDQDPANALVTTMATEKRINSFFRLHEPEIIRRLRERLPLLPANPDPQQVFLGLRQLRNDW